MPMRLVMMAILISIGAALGTAAPAHADSAQDRARAAVAAGEIRSLQDILGRLRGEFDGRVLDAELDESGRNRWIYKIKVLTGDGRVLALTVDARTADVLQVRGRDD